MKSSNTDRKSQTAGLLLVLLAMAATGLVEAQHHAAAARPATL